MNKITQLMQDITDYYTDFIPIKPSLLSEANISLSRVAINRRAPTRVHIDIDQLGRKLPDCRSFSNRIHDVAKKIKYDKGILEWEKSYILLTLDDIKHKEIPNSHIGDSVINVDEELNAFIPSFIEAVKHGDERKHKVFYGTKGCGKSTFLKYTINKFSHEFIVNSIIPSRIEYSKILSEISGEQSSYEIKQKIANLTLRGLFRDSIRFLFCHKIFFELDSREYIQEKCAENLSIFTSCHPEADVMPNVKRVLKQTNNIISNIQLINKLNGIPKSEKIEFIRFCRDELQADFLPIFDGCDVISTHDYVNSSTSQKLISEIIDFAFKEHGGAIIDEPGGEFKFHAWIVLRKETYSRMQLNNVQCRSESIEFLQIVSPPTSKVFLNFTQLLYDFLDKNKFNIHRGEFETFFSSLIELLDDKLNISNLEFLFNGDIRLCKEFIKSSIILFYFILPNEQLFNNYRFDKKTGVTSLIKRYNRFSQKQRIQKKYYRLSYLLINRQKDSVVNRTTIKFKDDSFSAKDISHTAGVMDNIFNYNHSDISDINLLLQKVRILLLLKHLGKDGLTQTQIESVFDQIYQLTPLKIEIDLAVLCRVGYVCSRFYDGGGHDNDIVYYLDNRGKILLNSFIHNNVYLENIFFNCILPDSIHKRFSTPKSVKIEDWVITSIRNTYVLLKVIQNIEAKSQCDQKYLIGNKMAESLLHTTQDILISDLKKKFYRKEEGFYKRAIKELAAARDFIHA